VVEGACQLQERLQASFREVSGQHTQPSQHGRDLLQLYEEHRAWVVMPGTDCTESIVVLMMQDGGQDENPSFYRQLCVH